MARLIYSMIASLDGYIEDTDGSFDWAVPDDEVHSFVNDLERSIGTYLYGRRMYEIMAAWETMHTIPDQPSAILDFAGIWQSAEKVVYSRSLDSVSTARTRLERDFDPEAVQQLKMQASQDITIAGPGLAAAAFRAGLIDECQLFVVPTIVGGGKHALPSSLFLKLDLLDERRFGNGMVYLRYRTEV